MKLFSPGGAFVSNQSQCWKTNQNSQSQDYPPEAGWSNLGQQIGLRVQQQYSEAFSDRLHFLSSGGA